MITKKIIAQLNDLKELIQEKMTINELTIYLQHFNKSQIYQMVHREEIPYKNNGKELIFCKEKIDFWNKKRLEKIEKDKKYLSLKELMDFLNPPLSKRTIYQYVNDGKIPCHHQKGKFLRFNKKEIKRWDDEGRPFNF